MQLAQATQSHCGVSLLRPQQLHGQTFSRNQPGLDLQLHNKMQMERDSWTSVHDGLCAMCPSAECATIYIIQTLHQTR